MLNYTKNIRLNQLASIDSEDFMLIAQSAVVIENVQSYRMGNDAAKKNLPAVCYMGRTRTGLRKAADMVPTGYVMLDVDHVDEARVPDLARCLADDAAVSDNAIMLVHITPSGRGIRVVSKMPQKMLEGSVEQIARNIVTYQAELAHNLGLAAWGDVDTCVKDLSRLSFIPQYEDIIYINRALFDEEVAINLNENETQNHEDGAAQDAAHDKGDAEHATRNADNAVGNGVQRGESCESAAGSPAEAGRTGGADIRYGGVLVADIAAEYVKDNGEPEDGQRHTFYNRMVSDFRNLCNNDPEILVDVLPLFGQTRQHRLSQCKSICQRNTTRLLPKTMWCWLKDKGYYVDTRKEAEDDDVEDYNPYAEEEALLERMPALPPVFREIVNAAPKKMKLATLFAMLPIVGTAATYLQAELYDGTMQTPSFYTIIHAPAGSGKSFVKRFLELSIDKSNEANLLHKLIERDFVSAARMNLWNLGQQQKGANDKSKKRPAVSTRICETITSQADLLPVMKDNHGMHMFMYAAEIDTLMKGMKAGGGGDKNDLFRVAWDNESYGQSYRNSISFRGKVDMYLNVLATGTEQQLRRMFKDVENGLVSRCLFTDLGDQRFAKYEPWKKLSKRDLNVIDNWRNRCDAETYKSALAVSLDSIEDYEDEESFDENVAWEYEFKGRKTVDFSALNKQLLKWLEAQRKQAEKNADMAHDAFRKRAAVNGFRAALAAYSCWKKVTAKEMKVITDFAIFVADAALLKYLKTWGDDYNTLYSEQGKSSGKPKNFDSLFDSLPAQFNKGALKVACNKCAVSTPIKNIVSRWKASGLIAKVAKNEWKKL